MKNDDRLSREVIFFTASCSGFIWFAIKKNRRALGCSAEVEEPEESHPVDRSEAQDVETLGHDGGRGLAKEHPPHVYFDHLT